MTGGHCVKVNISIDFIDDLAQQGAGLHKVVDAFHNASNKPFAVLWVVADIKVTQSGEHSVNVRKQSVAGCRVCPKFCVNTEMRCK